jgi:hypothetical protein
MGSGKPYEKSPMTGGLMVEYPVCAPRHSAISADLVATTVERVGLSVLAALGHPHRVMSLDALAMGLDGAHRSCL